jgi:hypothetical protein
LSNVFFLYFLETSHRPNCNDVPQHKKGIHVFTLFWYILFIVFLKISFIALCLALVNGLIEI